MSAGTNGTRRMLRDRAEPGWTVWRVRGEQEDARGDTALGQPGLWHAVRRREGVSKIFDCPSANALGQWHVDRDGDRDASTLHAETRNWAAATLRSELPDGWTAPPAEEVMEWVPSDRLTLRIGPHIVQGELERTEKRLRVVFHELVRLPTASEENRLDWTHELCLDAQSRWHMVRFGLVDEQVQAEVDLSGVPLSVARPVLLRSLEALAFSVRWVLPALAIVADPGVASQALEHGPWWGRAVVPHRALRRGAPRAGMRNESQVPATSHT